MGWSEEAQAEVRSAGYRHDVGKILMRTAVLVKDGPLSDEERSDMKDHPTDGHQLLRNISEARIVRAVLHHHERFDGSGYPARLIGKAIPLYSRIVAVA